MDKASKLVVLIHGWFSSSWLMMPLANRIGSVGFETRIWGYPSLRKDIQTHASRFGEFLKLLAKENPQRDISIVAHSMGSIVTRQALLDIERPAIQRLVLLGPPNRGSHIATRVTRMLGGRCRTLDQIADRADSFVNRLPDPPLDTAREAAWPEIGIIRATRDRVVRPEAAQLNAAKQIVDVKCMHNMLLFLPRSAELCIRFLQVGQF